MTASRYLLFATALISSPAQAEDKWVVQPVQVGSESIRYLRGVPTVELETRSGVVRVTPLPMDHGSLAFTVAVFNDSDQPSNIGIENLLVSVAEAPVPVLSNTELVRKARQRAFWSQFGLAVAGAAASGLAASQRNYYSSTLVTPRGTYRSHFSAPSVWGQYQAAALASGTTVGVLMMEYQLDRTILALGDTTLQLTTVDPGESFAGRVVLKKASPRSVPAPVNLTVSWNGETYPFTFQVAKPGTPAPPFTNLTRSRLYTETRGRSMQLAAVPPRQATPTPPPAAQQPRRSIGTGSVRCITCRQ